MVRGLAQRFPVYTSAGASVRFIGAPDDAPEVFKKILFT
jgi:hypothetical protein